MFRSFTENFKEPDLCSIGNGERFPTVGITILLDELTHESDCVTGRRTTLQHNALQLLYHEETRLVAQFFTSRDGGFADAQTLLV